MTQTQVFLLGTIEESVSRKVWKLAQCKKMVILLLMPLFVFISCSASYGPLNGSSGYSEVEIDKNTIQVKYRGNQHQNKDAVRMRLIYRCSEITLESGFEHFILIKDDSYKHVEKREFGNADLSFETTTSMSGGVNNRVKSDFGAQDADAYFMGIFTIRMLKYPEARSINSKSFLQENNRAVSLRY